MTSRSEAWKRPAAIVVLATALAVAGCGGDDDGTDEPQPDVAPTTTESTTPATPEPPHAEPEDEAAADAQRVAGPDRELPETISREEFARRADRICGEARRDLERELRDAAAEAAEEGTAPTTLNPYSTGVTDLFRSTAADIAELPPPSTGPPPDEFVAAQRDYADLLADVGRLYAGAETIEDFDQAEVQELTTDLQEITERLTKLAREQGFEVCGAA